MTAREQVAILRPILRALTPDDASSYMPLNLEKLEECVRNSRSAVTEDQSDASGPCASLTFAGLVPAIKLGAKRARDKKGARPMLLPLAPHFVAVGVVTRAGKDDTLDVFIGGREPRYAKSAEANVATWSEPVDGKKGVEVQPGSPTEQLSVFVLKPGEPYTIVHRRHDRTIVVHQGIAEAHVIHLPPTPKKRRCLRLVTVVAPSQGQPEVFLDGERLQSVAYSADTEGKEGVLRALATPEIGDHELVVLDRAGKLLRTTIKLERRLGDESRCVTENFDLRRQDRAALVAVRVAGRCKAADIDATLVQNAAEAYLERALRQEFIDYEGLATIVEGVEGAQSKIDGSATVGANRGSLDTLRAIKTLASEYRRQGLRRALTLDVRCSKGAADEGWTFTFEAKQLDLQRAQGSSSALTGVDVVSLVTTEVETTHSKQGLHYAMSAPLARVLGLRYARLTGAGSADEEEAPGRTYAFLGHVLPYDVHGLPEGGDDQSGWLDVDMVPIADSEVPGICGPIADRNRLAGKEAFNTAKAAPGPLQRGREPRWSGLIDATRGNPGTYLARIRSDGEIYDQQCVEVVQRNYVVWADTGVGLTVSKWNGASARYTRLRAGVRFFGKYELVDFSVMLGFTNAAFSIDEPSSWDAVVDGTIAPRDVVRGTYASPLRWEKTSVIVGPLWEFRTGVLPKTGPVGVRFVADVTPALSFGYVDGASLPRGLRSLGPEESGDSTFDADLVVQSDIGARVNIGSRIELDLRLASEWSGVEDLIAGALDGPGKLSANYDPYFVLGGAAHVGWAW
ncbi:MAG: hypothetical protein KC731_09650 [Myxococcales bacterium]|nr:hypothetical protein [Myxococcales bacterium]